ncbi:hypothetical protein BpHYR1_037593 [Brachionus plicatilis]|uniref:Uncharacterized protein n=1 Tax=Brachionus plicatilis TaxID=10195 RepID=A0A3M7SBN0_BRAPC|nr:hypothetical protein BpHYR1_037593 [Brachionus plicatilis]
MESEIITKEVVSKLIDSRKLKNYSSPLESTVKKSSRLRCEIKNQNNYTKLRKILVKWNIEPSVELRTLIWGAHTPPMRAKATLRPIPVLLIGVGYNSDVNIIHVD